MPPKTITCAVCNETVLKAQTLARTDGSRACRTHEGVTAEAEKLASAQRSRLEQEVKKGSTPFYLTESYLKEREEQSAKFEKEMNARREKIYSRCWICDCDGLELRDFFMQALIAMKRLQIRGEFNFMSMPADVRKLIGPQRPLGAIVLRGETIDKAIIKHVRDRNRREIIPLVGFILFCPECAEKHGFKARWDALMPTPTWDQVEAIMPAMAVVDPLLVALAEKKENQS